MSNTSVHVQASDYGTSTVECLYFVFYCKLLMNAEGFLCYQSLNPLNKMSISQLYSSSNIVSFCYRNAWAYAIT